MRHKLIIPFFLIFFITGFSQRAFSQTYEQQERGAFLYNIGTGLVIGALINKKKGQDPWKVFLKGAGQGALGGAINYSSKNITGLIAQKENYLYGWPGRLSILRRKGMFQGRFK